MKHNFLRFAIGLTLTVLVLLAVASNAPAAQSVARTALLSVDRVASNPLALPASSAPITSTTFSQVSAGVYHTCALTNDGGVKCWGKNNYGQLGDGTTIERHTPVDVVGLSSGVIALATGSDQSCALTIGGGVKCWGRNDIGQSGDGTGIERHTPVDVSGLTSGVSSISAGGGYACAVTDGGGAKCWGANGGGRLGDGTTTNRLTPVDVEGLTNGVASITAGGRFTCAVTTAGAAKCWGYNDNGELGDGTTTNRYTPVDVSGLDSGVAAIAAGLSHTCALMKDGSAKCWGDNVSGDLGDGSGAEQHTPVSVSGILSGGVAIVSGYGHNCVLMNSGGLKCWGWNLMGQLGDGTTTDRPTPVEVNGLAGKATAIAAGGDHTCAVIEDGSLQCWGLDTNGQLGNGIAATRATPVVVVGLNAGITAVTSGHSHVCALADSGAVQCWGLNNYGQLGDGTTIDAHSPIEVTGLISNVSAIAAGYSHTCAVIENGGGVKCWGWNGVGQLGDGTQIDKHQPVDVIGLTGVKSLAAGNGHTCALTNVGSVK